MNKCEIKTNISHGDSDIKYSFSFKALAQSLPNKSLKMGS